MQVKKRQKKVFLFGSGAFLLLVIIFVLATDSDPARRVMREQGVPVPKSASKIVCGGDAAAWKRVFGFPDCGAIATLEMPASDLSGLLSALTVLKTSAGVGDTVVPVNPQYAVAASWAATSPDTSYHCSSPKGDFLTVRMWSISATQVGVLLYTDWN